LNRGGENGESVHACAPMGEAQMKKGPKPQRETKRESRYGKGRSSHNADRRHSRRIN
jgi:hypothetical protein